MNSTPCDTKALCQLKTHLISAKGADWAVIYQGAVAPWPGRSSRGRPLEPPLMHWRHQLRGTGRTGTRSPLPWSLRMYVCTFVNFYLQCTKSLVHGHWAVIQTGSEQHTFFHTGCCIPIVTSLFSLLYLCRNFCDSCLIS